MSNENKSQIDAIIELLDDTEFSLESFNLEPVFDEDGEITGLTFTLINELLDLRKGSDSALKVLEDNFIGDQVSFKDVLEKIEEDEANKEEE